MSLQRASLRITLASCLLLPVGCSNNGQTEVSLNNGGNSGVIGGSGKGGQAELTPQQGQKLLAEIRKDPNRLQKLTLPERRYLAKAGVDARGQKPDR